MATASSKTVKAAIKKSTIETNPDFFQIPFEQHENETVVKECLQARYAPNTGKLQITVENDVFQLKWVPNTIDKESEAYHYAAVEFSKKKLYDRAIRNWQKALERNPDDVDYLYSLAILNFDRKKYAESIQLLEKAVSVCPIHYRALLLLGINWIKLRKFNKAEHYVLESHYLHDKNVLSYLNLGVIYSVKREFDKALEMYTRCTELSPKEARAYLGMARIHDMLNDRAAANTYFRKVIKLVPDSKLAEYSKRSIKLEDEEKHGLESDKLIDKKNISAEQRENQFSQGMGMYLHGKYKMSSTQYKSYLQSHPSDDYGWYLLGETLLRTGELEESADCFKRAIRLNGKRGVYYKSLGISLHYLGKSPDVIQVLKKAMELGKRDSLSLTLYGINLMFESRIDEGINVLQMAMKKNPNNPLAMYNLAMGLIKTHEEEKARQLLTRIEQFSYHAPIKEQAEKLKKTLTSGM